MILTNILDNFLMYKFYPYQVFFLQKLLFIDKVLENHFVRMTHIVIN